MTLNLNLVCSLRSQWQLGFFAKEFTPTYRGFDSFYGFWTSGQDYFNHVTYDGSYGLDLRRDLSVSMSSPNDFVAFLSLVIYSLVVEHAKPQSELGEWVRLLVQKTPSFCRISPRELPNY